jgi:hypothetical protein
MLAQQPSTLYAMGKYAPSRSEPGSAKEKARRLCAQKVRMGSTMARNLEQKSWRLALWRLRVRCAKKNTKNVPHLALLGRQRHGQHVVYVCVYCSSQIPPQKSSFYSRVATLSDVGVVWCDAMRCERERERERERGRENGSGGKEEEEEKDLHNGFVRSVVRTRTRTPTFNRKAC